MGSRIPKNLFVERVWGSILYWGSVIDCDEWTAHL